MRRNILTTVACSALALTASGCLKKKPVSAVKSVDAIVNADETNRKAELCGGDPNLADASPEAAVDRVFARVPKLFKTQLPGLHGSIKLDDDATVKSTCLALFEAQAKSLFSDEKAAERAVKRLENLGSCWSLNLSADMPDVPTPTIHIVSDPTGDAVHRNMLAMVTYAILELYVDRIGGEFAKQSSADRSKQLDTLRAAGVNATESETLDFVEKMNGFRNDVAKAVVTDLKDREEILTRYKEDWGLKLASDGSLDEDGTPKMAKNYFFAEAIDSYYCSTTTKKQFKQQGLTETRKVMKRVAAYLNGKAS